MYFLRPWTRYIISFLQYSQHIHFCACSVSFYLIFFGLKRAYYTYYMPNMLKMTVALKQFIPHVCLYSTRSGVDLLTIFWSYFPCSHHSFPPVANIPPITFPPANTQYPIWRAKPSMVRLLCFHWYRMAATTCIAINCKQIIWQISLIVNAIHVVLINYWFLARIT